MHPIQNGPLWYLLTSFLEISSTFRSLRASIPANGLFNLATVIYKLIYEQILIIEIKTNIPFNQRYQENVTNDI